MQQVTMTHFNIRVADCFCFAHFVSWKRFEHSSPALLKNVFRARNGSSFQAVIVITMSHNYIILTFPNFLFEIVRKHNIE